MYWLLSWSMPRSARPAVVVEKMAVRAETMRNGRDREAVRMERDCGLVRVAWGLRVPLAMAGWRVKISISTGG